MQTTADVDHVGWFAWHSQIQDRIDESYGEPDAEGSFGMCMHRDACRRAVALTMGERAAKHASIWLECDKCYEWEE